MPIHARALAALRRLHEGNRRFASNVRSVDSLLSQLKRAELAQGQDPHSIILGCSDSRAPAEIVFDQGLGDLFVIRVAGNIVAPSGVGSVEFAADRFACRLVVVMGHTRCGAIDAALESMRNDGGAVSRNLMSIVQRVRPALESLRSMKPDMNLHAVERDAVRANVRASVAQLRHGSEVLEQLVDQEGLLMIGAVYDLETGVVEWIDPPREAAETLRI